MDDENKATIVAIFGGDYTYSFREIIEDIVGCNKKRPLDPPHISSPFSAEISKKFRSDIKNAQFPDKDGDYFQLPAHYFLHKSAQKRSPITLMNRTKTKEMCDFIVSHRGWPAVVVQGPRGVGKSYNLYQILCTLSCQPNTRVIFVDCAFWGSLDYETAHQFLLECIMHAFAEDPNIISQCNAAQTTLSITNFLEYIPTYCQEKQLVMYAIFDQHNDLTEEQRKKVPYSWLEGFLPAVWRTRETLMVLTTNKYLQVANNNKWPTFNVNQGYTKTEFEAWAKKEQFFPSVELSDVEYWTNSMPLELEILLQTSKSHVGTDATALCAVLADYRSARRLEFHNLQQKFEEECCSNTNNMDALRQAIVWMSLGVRNPYTIETKINPELMFKDEKGIFRAITPIVYEVLTNRNRFPEFSEDFDVAATLVMKAPLHEFPVDAKRRAFEKFVLRKWEQDQAIKTTAFIINPDIDPDLWARIEIDISDCTVCHFTGNNPQSLDWERPALLIPEPSHDPKGAFFFDPANGLLLVCQFAIFETKDIEMDLNFDLFWKDRSGNKIKTIQRLWVSTNKSANSYKGDLVTTHAELSLRFPALRGFVPK
eukprot:Phypoly_transcript_04760.p1 GENE.Phypoly_transcript_04760~~Phypoly_transcript_04760.p1  ORF type:complete len:650 (-),score=82.11 Phypoly_transcript_04760:159-1943(-)